MIPTVKKLDKIWSDKVKERDGGCLYCGRKDYVNSHHIFSRSKKSTRWDLDNGVSLCVAHHVFSSVFSAHKTPAEFIEWIKEKRGEEWYNKLRLRANSVDKRKRDAILEELCIK